MSQNKQLLVLNNAMDSKIDVFISPFNLQPSYQIAINITYIVSIKLKYTKYDKINLSYYVITLISGKKIYVNQWNAKPIGLFSYSCERNADDYETVKTFIQ